MENNRDGENKDLKSSRFCAGNENLVAMSQAQVRKSPEATDPATIWVDSYGREYNDSEVEYRDVDTPGPQFSGWVTKESVRGDDCINHWVSVMRKQNTSSILKMDKLPDGAYTHMTEKARKDSSVGVSAKPMDEIVNVLCQAMQKDGICPRASQASAPSEDLLRGVAHEIFAVAQLMPKEGIEDAVDRIVEVLREILLEGMFLPQYPVVTLGADGKRIGTLIIDETLADSMAGMAHEFREGMDLHAITKVDDTGHPRLLQVSITQKPAKEADRKTEVPEWKRMFQIKPCGKGAILCCPFGADGNLAAVRGKKDDWQYSLGLGKEFQDEPFDNEQEAQKALDELKDFPNFCGIREGYTAEDRVALARAKGYTVQPTTDVTRAIGFVIRRCTKEANGMNTYAYVGRDGSWFDNANFPVPFKTGDEAWDAVLKEPATDKTREQLKPLERKSNYILEPCKAGYVIRLLGNGKMPDGFFGTEGIWLSNSATPFPTSEEAWEALRKHDEKWAMTTIKVKNVADSKTRGVEVTPCGQNGFALRRTDSPGAFLGKDGHWTMDTLITPFSAEAEALDAASKEIATTETNEKSERDKTLRAFKIRRVAMEHGCESVRLTGYIIQRKSDVSSVPTWFLGKDCQWHSKMAGVVPFDKEVDAWLALDPVLKKAENASKAFIEGLTTGPFEREYQACWLPDPKSPLGPPPPPIDVAKAQGYSVERYLDGFILCRKRPQGSFDWIDLRFQYLGKGCHRWGDTTTAMAPFSTEQEAWDAVPTSWNDEPNKPRAQRKRIASLEMRDCGAFCPP